MALGIGLALGALISSCGGGGGKTEAASSLTKRQWLKQANAICIRGTREMGKLDEAAWARFRAAQKSPSERIRDQVALALLPARENELRQIRALGTPRGDEAQVEKMLDAWGEGIRKGKKNPRSLRDVGYDFAFYESYSMGIDYGLKSCWLG